MTKFLPLYKTRYRCELENPQERADILYHMREYRDQWHKNKHLPGFETFKNASDEAVYINMLQRRLKEKGWKINHHPDIEVMFIQATLDDAWCDLQRPYYNVWPKILQSLLRLDLSKVPSESLEPSYEPLALRLPESVSFSMGRCQDRLDITQAVVGCLFAFLPAPEKYKDGALSRFLCVLQCKTSDGRILNGGYSVTLRKGCTVEQCIQQGLEDAGGWGIDEELRTETAENLLKLAICTRMLRQDSEFLTKAFIDLTDAQQTALLKDKRALQEYEKKHGTGFDLGREGADVSPHLRNPHPWWKPHGPGKTLRTLDFRKGSIVRRDKLKEVPSGWAERIDPDKPNDKEEDKNE